MNGDITVTEHWAYNLAPERLNTLCACGKPATSFHIRKIPGIPNEVELYCEECCPVVVCFPALSARAPQTPTEPQTDGDPLRPGTPTDRQD